MNGQRTFLVGPKKHQPGINDRWSKSISFRRVLNNLDRSLHKWCVVVWYCDHRNNSDFLGNDAGNDIEAVAASCNSTDVVTMYGIQSGISMEGNPSTNGEWNTNLFYSSQAPSSARTGDWFICRPYHTALALLRMNWIEFEEKPCIVRGFAIA